MGEYFLKESAAKEKLVMPETDPSFGGQLSLPALREPISKIISTPIAKFRLRLVKKSSQDTQYIAHFF
jgi:hypothetical protein